MKTSTSPVNTKKYFFDPYTKESIKKQFRELCKTLHPDKGGNGAEFIEMQKQYKFLLFGFARPGTPPPKKKPFKKNNTFVKVISINIDLKEARKLFKTLMK